jgi:hypothetical protein
VMKLSSQQEEAPQPTKGVPIEPRSNEGQLMGDAIRATGGDPSGMSPAAEPL